MNLQDLLYYYNRTRQEMEERIGAPIKCFVDDWICTSEPPKDAEEHLVEADKPFISYTKEIDGVMVKCFKDVEP
jgi:hypothetical protein